MLRANCGLLLQILFFPLFLLNITMSDFIFFLMGVLKLSFLLREVAIFLSKKENKSKQT